MKDAGQEIAPERSRAVGTVVIGAGPTWLRRYLPPALARTISAHPAMFVRFEAGFDESLFHALPQGELVFVIAEIPSPEDRRDWETLTLTSIQWASAGVRVITCPVGAGSACPTSCATLARRPV